MNDFSNRSQTKSLGTSEPVERLNMDEATWWKKQDSVPNATSLISPLSPLSFAFLNPDQRDAFNFPISPLSGNNNNEKTKKADGNDKFKLETDSPTSSSTSSSSSSRKTLQVKDLLVVDDDEPSSSTDGYEPKAHLGWASFGESIQLPPKKTSPDPNQGKRKVYVVRPHRERSRPYQIANPIVSRNLKAPKTMNKFQLSKSKSMVSSKSGKESSDTDDDEIVDVVGIDEDEAAVRRAMESGNPPDLPPQRPLGSRFEMQRQKKGNLVEDVSEYQQQNCEKLENVTRKQSRSESPPPQLEPQLSKATDAPHIEKDEVQEELVPVDDVDKKVPGYFEHNPTQLLKTKISSSAIPILPLSKSIMERKKAAIEMTKNAVIKRVPAPKSNTKNLTVAPKSVQVPAYADKTSITLYSNLNKPSTIVYPRDNARNCQRCKERSAVDMSNFKFLEDSNVITVRAHLCDQTRVMIARTAMFNREYARRLGDRSHGTIWQKPDEVTAQMTGFCSATVRRCIDIANLSIVPKCADRIGVSKNELTSLKTAFGEEKFCGQTMRTPHVLSQYYSIKAQSMAAAASTNQASCSKVPPEPKEKTPEDLRREEEEKKHHPLSYHVNTVAVSPTPSPAPALKKTVLRWSSIQAPRILRAPIKMQMPVPKTTVIPVLKAEKNPETIPTHRRRGRPKKERTEEEKVKPVRASRRLKLKKNNEVEAAVRQTVEFLVSTVVKKA